MAPLPLAHVCLALAMLVAGCSMLMRGNEAACLEACRREGGSAQGTSPCEQGCRSKAKKQSTEWKSDGEKSTASESLPTTSGSLGIFW